MGRLTTHILDTAAGMPAAGVRIDLVSAPGAGEEHLATAITNSDGRCDGAFAEGEGFGVGVYELRFHIGVYLRRRLPDLPTPAFLDVVPIRFGIAAAADHYHVPLLISPYGYSTYRGS